MRVSRRLSSLAVQQSHQEVDVAHGQPQDLVLAELFLRRVCGDEFPQLCESCVDVMLAPALACVGEHLPGHDTAVLLQKKNRRSCHCLNMSMRKNEKNFVNSNEYTHLPLSVVLKLYERWSIRHKFSSMKN